MRQSEEIPKWNNKLLCCISCKRVIRNSPQPSKTTLLVLTIPPRAEKRVTEAMGSLLDAESVYGLSYDVNDVIFFRSKTVRFIIERQNVSRRCMADRGCRRRREGSWVSCRRVSFNCCWPAPLNLCQVPLSAVAPSNQRPHHTAASQGNLYLILPSNYAIRQFLPITN